MSSTRVVRGLFCIFSMRPLLEISLLHFVISPLGCRRGQAGRVPRAGTRCFSGLSVPDLVTAEFDQTQCFGTGRSGRMQDAFIRLARSVRELQVSKLLLLNRCCDSEIIPMHTGRNEQLTDRASIPLDGKVTAGSITIAMDRSCHGQRRKPCLL